MTYFYGQRRPERKYRGTPQWTLDQLFITPFSARRRYDEEGIIHYDPIERNMYPTGIHVMDHFLQRLAAGNDRMNEFCNIYGLRTEDMDGLVYILTGMSGPEYRKAYRLRMVDELLRYTDMSFDEIAKRTGFGTHGNLCVVFRHSWGQSPTVRRKRLRNPRDVGRYIV